MYFVNRYSLTPMITLLVTTRHGVIYDFYFFGRRWSHYFILLSATTLCKISGYDLQLHLKYRNNIWNKKTKIQYCLCTKIFLRLPHPRRPRGGQSGREKRRNESFQVRAKEPLGTDSHRTMSKNSSGCRLLIGHKKCFVLCPIGEEFLLSSFRKFVHDGYCPVRSPSWCVQGKLLFSTFLTRNEGTTDESKTRLGCYQQEQFNLPREYSVFDGSQV